MSNSQNVITVEIDVDAAHDGSRLDRFLAEQVAGISRSAAQSLIGDGRVTVNGAPARASHRLRPGDAVVARLQGVPQTQEAQTAAEAIPLQIVFEDDWLLVVDKPAGMVVHPAPGHSGGTLANAVLAHCPEMAASGDPRPGIVHRLDRDTSGLIVVAKSEAVRQALQLQFKEHRVRKVYLALVHGHLQAGRGRIEAPLGRDPRHRQRMAVVPGGREAVTGYLVLEHLAAPGRAGGEFTFLQAEPETGRTHQIRVHLASIGHPVAGDTIYGRRRAGLPLDRHFLHAGRLEFRHPVTGQDLAFEAPLPEDLEATLRALRAR